jgi:putative transposase
MARPLRIEFPGALYHVTSRGDGQDDIYRGDTDRHAFLAVLSTFAETQRAAVSAYRRFVEDGIGEPGPWQQLRHQIFLGSEAFVEGVRRNLPPGRDLTEVPRAQRRPRPKPLVEYARTYRGRDGAIAAAYASGGYTLKEVGAFFGLHYAQVSRIARKVRDAKDKTLTPFLTLYATPLL